MKRVIIALLLGLGVLVGLTASFVPAANAGQHKNCSSNSC